MDNKDNFLMNIAKSIKVPAELTKSALEPSANQIGEGLGNLFYLAFASITKAKIRKEYEIKKFKEEIENEISKIKPENIVEPPINIVGPALEASKYYIENDEIRSMFSKLIASSMDKEKNQDSHTSFIEIIKQLSPLDAKNFKFLINNQNIGVGTIRLKKINGSGEFNWFDNFFPFPELNSSNHSLYSASIDNLIRLGLISIDKDSTYLDKSRYNNLKLHPLFSFSIETANENQDVSFFKDNKAILLKHTWNITSFGKLFGHCCL